MAKRGRKPIAVPTLVFWEGHWWSTFSRMRDGIKGGEAIDNGPMPPDFYQNPMRPSWMTHPGSIHDWDRKQTDDYLSRWESRPFISKGISAEPHLWEALTRAQTVSHVRRICSKSRWRSSLQMLYEHADKFICARNEDSRYPRKARNKDNQRMLNCAQIMAGICCRVRPETATDKLRKLRHPQVRRCNCPDCTNFKAALLQWTLFDVDEMGKSKPDGKVWSLATREGLRRLDHDCNCTHCVVMSLVKRTRWE